MRKTQNHKVHNSLAENSHDQKQPPRPSANEWTGEMGGVYTRQCYSATKKNENMPPAALWRDLDTVLLSKVRQMGKAIYPMTSLVCSIKEKSYK